MTNGDISIIDGHHHYGNLSAGLPGFVHADTTDDFDATELSTRLGIMDEQGVRQAVMIAGHAYLRPDGLADTRRVNDSVAAYRDRRPDRFPVAVGVVEPLYGKAGFAEIARCRDELGMAGISFHARFQGVSMDSPWVYEYIECMGEHGLIPYLHAIGDSPEESLWKIDGLAAAQPDMTMMVVDAFSNFEQLREMLPIAERRPNLVFDTSLAYNFELIAPAITRLGVDRFFYGSDVYSWPAAARRSHILSQILESDLAHGDKVELLGGTLRRILGLPAASGASR